MESMWIPFRVSFNSTIPFLLWSGHIYNLQFVRQSLVFLIRDTYMQSYLEPSIMRNLHINNSTHTHTHIPLAAYTYMHLTIIRLMMMNSDVIWHRACMHAWSRPQRQQSLGRGGLRVATKRLEGSNPFVLSDELKGKKTVFPIHGRLSPILHLPCCPRYCSLQIKAGAESSEWDISLFCDM